VCGFAAILTNRSGMSLERPLLRMLKALRHRGPDASAAGEIRLQSGWKVGLAHARLAILDTSDAGLQPMGTRDRNLWTVFNGEIYNHQELRRELKFAGWRTGTDTETILHAWQERGEASVDSLRGMFGLCVLDVEKQVFWAVRDRLGIKPVCIARVDDSLILIASELRSILASGLVNRRLHRQSLPNFFAMGAVTAPWTMVEGVERLRPAEMQRIDLSAKSPVGSARTYWSVPFIKSQPLTASDVQTRIGELKTAFDDASSNHLLSDVPVGVFLSGGIDSGAIVEAISRRHSQVETFSVAFADRKFDESLVAEKTADRFGTRHRTLLLSPAEMLRLIPAAFSAYDSPSYDGVNTWFISKVVREAGVKVALSGVGADELFAGYSYHRAMVRLGHSSYRIAARGVAAALRLAGQGNIRATKLGMAAATTNRIDQYLAIRRIVTPDLVRELLPGSAKFDLPPGVRRACEQAVEGLDPVNAFSCLDMAGYMQNTILRDADQMSMAHGLELRVPFLDHEVVEAVAALPGRLKIEQFDGHPNKALLLRLLDRPLPSECTDGKKRGFVFPWDRWLRHELRDFTVDSLRNRRAIEAAGLNEAAIEKISSHFQAGDRNVRSADILCLLTLLNWVERVILGDFEENNLSQSTGYVEDLRALDSMTALVV
jgi:asparagine synthase (glutamine-hydrolysing)